MISINSTENSNINHFYTFAKIAELVVLTQADTKHGMIVYFELLLVRGDTIRYVTPHTVYAIHHFRDVVTVKKAEFKLIDLSNSPEIIQAYSPHFAKSNRA